MAISTIPPKHDDLIISLVKEGLTAGEIRKQLQDQDNTQYSYPAVCATIRRIKKEKKEQIDSMLAQSYGDQAKKQSEIVINTIDRFERIADELLSKENKTNVRLALAVKETQLKFIEHANKHLHVTEVADEQDQNKWIEQFETILKRKATKKEPEIEIVQESKIQDTEDKSIELN